MKDSLYIVGGAFSSSIDIFDLNTRTFNTVNSLNEVRDHFGSCQYDENNSIIAGGRDMNFVLTSTCYLYNVITNSLKQVGSLNIKRHGHVLVKSEDGGIYAIGGAITDNVLSSVEKFDKRLQTWKLIEAKLIVERYQPQAVAYKNFIFIIGGKQTRDRITNSIEKFNTRTGEMKIIQAKLKVGRCHFAIAKYNQLAYIMGGIVSDLSKKPVEILNSFSVEVFNLELETVEEGKSIPFEDSGFTAHVV